VVAGGRAAVPGWWSRSSEPRHLDLPLQLAAEVWAFYDERRELEVAWQACYPGTMPERELHLELLSHLVDEFGDAGRRAVGALRSAQVLVDGGDHLLPNSSDHVAFALRTALLALLETPDAPRSGQWARTSRAVADAKIRYQTALGLSGYDAADALQDLLNRIDDMAQVHAQESLHEQRLIAIMFHRTGVSPVAAGLEPVKAFDRLLSKLNRAVHAGATVAQAREYWDTCVSILERLFLPPHVRNADLERLAALAAFGADDVARALVLFATPQHLRYFLSHTDGPGWTQALAEGGLLDPPTEGGVWPMFAAVEALRENHAEALTAVLAEIADRCQGDPRQTWYVARATLDVGSTARNLVLMAARRHVTDAALTSFALDAARNTDPRDEFVMNVADVVLNAGALRAHMPYLDDLMDALADGTGAGNWHSRVRLLCQKLS